jgi:KaiC/GvpD/RAD55 family RecA-like ATPase
METYPSDEELLRQLLKVSVNLSDILHELEATGVDLNEKQDAEWGEATDVIELIREKRQRRQYLVRPDDSMVFQSDENGLYSPIDIPRMHRPYDHFTYENLTRLGFFTIDISDIEHYKKKCTEYYQDMINDTKWQ